MVRYLWASPTTLLGLALALTALHRGRVLAVGGVLEVSGPLVRWALRHLVPLHGGAIAITLGHVVLGRDACALDETRAHERVHVRQYERWGPLFVPAYVAASIWAVVRGGHFYFDNVFEREAMSACSGDSMEPPMPMRGGARARRKRTAGERRSPGSRQPLDAGLPQAGKFHDVRAWHPICLYTGHRAARAGADAPGARWALLEVTSCHAGFSGPSPRLR